ncbi:MAG TPA: site-specific integrase [Vicinamibacterales bacterium]|nr:site-specific integrase [Vicinamibacterales bacterium]
MDPVQGHEGEAQNKLIELLHEQNQTTLIEPNKITLGEWLVKWVEKFTKPRTADTYKGVLKNHLVPKLGAIRLQELKPMHLETYYREQRGTLSESTLEQHHMIISGCLKAAERNGLVPRNVAKFVDDKPKPTADVHAEVEQHCWTEEEQARFFAAAQAAGTQPAAFYGLGLETGMRKSELGGLRWKDVDLVKGEIRLREQIVLRPGHPFTFGPLKGKRPHTLSLSAETVALLRRHKAHQAEVKLQAGGKYHDHGLVFAREWGGKYDTLGEPLHLNNIGQREFATLSKAAGVRRIKFHGMRHTNATLALADGESPKVVQERLGHKKITTTLDIYAHVLPEQNRAAADRMGARLHGKR